jgi:hypothetical protein
MGANDPLGFFSITTSVCNTHITSKQEGIDSIWWTQQVRPKKKNATKLAQLFPRFAPLVETTYNGPNFLIFEHFYESIHFLSSSVQKLIYFLFIFVIDPRDRGRMASTLMKCIFSTLKNESGVSK